MKYNIHNLIGAYCVTPQRGQELYDIIHPLLTEGTAVELDFLGVKAYASPDADVNRLVKFSNLSRTGENVRQMVMSSAKRYYTDDSYRQAVHEVREEELAAC